MAETYELYANPSALEPLFPVDYSGELREMAGGLLRKSAQLGGALHPVTRRSVVDLLRAMNSYYSNLIEGHHTHPLAIERALRNDYSSDPALRALQLESRAHIEVQTLIEQRLEEHPETEVCASEFLCWIHREFYVRLPEEFHFVEMIGGGKSRVTPGGLRQGEVKVGRHIPPTFASLPAFLARFAEGYRSDTLDPLQRIIAVAASHHRLAWIHPFLDGNGRVARLFTHALFIRTQTDGHRLWTISRGLARRRADYLAALTHADAQRRNDLDGRGNLSDEGLTHFCRFFLGVALDQVDFMRDLLDLDAMKDRIRFFVEHWADRNRADENIPRLLCDVFMHGEITRGEATSLLQKPERSSRRIVGMLLKEGLLVSNAPGAPVRFGFPAALMGYYFPRLYPDGVEVDTVREMGGLYRTGSS